MANQTDLIDIILPVSGNYSLTKKCIDSIFKNTGNPFRLIIVDNGIEEPELLSYFANLKKEHNSISLISRDRSPGYAAALNKGIAVSTSDLIAILNNAVIVSKNWLIKLKAGLETDEQAAIIAPMCNNRFIPKIDVKFDQNRDIGLQLEEYNNFLEQSPIQQGMNPSPNMFVPYVLGYCMLIKKEVIEKCGGFDSIYGESMYFSDFDLCFRAARKDFKILISNKTVIYRDNSDLLDINHPKVKLPVNYNIFKKKWEHHGFFKYLPTDMFPPAYPKTIQQDEQGFYYNENLKSNPKKYLLIHPSMADTRFFWKFAYAGTVSPTGLLRVAHYLLNQGDKVNYFDFEPYNKEHPPEKLDLKAKEEIFAFGKKMEDFSGYIKNLKDIDEVFITVTMTYHYPHLSQLIEKIREVYGDIKITVGGLYATLCPDEITKLGVEVHVGPYFTADNLRPLIEMTSGKNSAVMRIVKGCPRTCSYCVVPGLEGRKVTQYQKDDIIKHFQEFYSLGYTIYMFWDSNLLFGKENLFLLFDYMVEYGYNETISLDFSYGLEFALIDDAFIEKLSKFKLKNSLHVPLESAEYDLYKTRFHRPNSHLGMMTKTVKKLQAAKHDKMHYYVMLGLPNQTLDQVLKTLIFGWRLAMTPMMMLYTPIPGTEEFPKYMHFYKDKETWELNPYLYPCESGELDKEAILFLDSFNHTALAYTEEEGFYLQRYYFSERPDYTKYISKVTKTYFEDQNYIMKRLKELVYEEGVKSEEVDSDTLRFFHALRM